MPRIPTRSRLSPIPDLPERVLDLAEWVPPSRRREALCPLDEFLDTVDEFLDTVGGGER